MGRLRAATGALIPDGASRTATIMEALDRCARGPEGVDFVTAASVVLDTATGELEVACAGHPPPLLVESDGTHRWLDDATTPPIGRLDVDRSVSSRFLLDVGDVVLLYSDGLIERRSRSMGFGMRKLRSIAPTLLDNPLETAVDTIIEQLVDDDASDDVMLVALRWSGPAT
jgi:serine phosphatase RsbU (regulator of sigma subunit)